MITKLGAAALAASLGLVAIGCGGGEDSSNVVRPSAGAQGKAKPSSPDAERSRRGRSKNGSTGRSHSSPGSTHPQSASQRRRSIGHQAVSQIPAEDRTQFSNTAAENTLGSLGFQHATVTTLQGGQVVIVAIQASDACAAGPRAVSQIRQKIRQIVPYAKRVGVRIIGTLKPAAVYARHCPRLQLPTASGRIVFSRAGTGLSSSHPLAIRSKHFTVSYENQSDALDIYVVNGKRLVKPVIQIRKRGVAKQVYGGPGTFQVTINGAGRWRVKVYDGA